jgi:hypothetical protein
MLLNAAEIAVGGGLLLAGPHPIAQQRWLGKLQMEMADTKKARGWSPVKDRDEGDLRVLVQMN